MQVEELRKLVDEGTRANPALKGRIEKAAFLVALRPIVKVGEKEWKVASEDGLKTYQVKDGECECSDYERHGDGFFCKHRLAIGLYTRLNGKGKVGEKVGPCVRCHEAKGLYNGLCGRCCLIVEREALDKTWS